MRYFRRSKGGVGDGHDRGRGGKMVLLGLGRVLAVEQLTEVESQVAAVVWLAHGGSLIRAALDIWWVVRHLMPHCLKLSIQILRYLVAHGFGTWGTLRLNPNVWTLGEIPMVENSNTVVIFSHHHEIQMLRQYLKIQNHNFQRIL